MKFPTKKVSYDANHFEIVRFLEAHGYGVVDLAESGNGMTDLLVSCRKTKITVATEIKTRGGRFKLAQLKFMAKFKGHLAFVETGEEAVAVMKNPDVLCLSEKYKEAIAKFLIRWEPEAREKQKSKNPEIRVSVFEAEIKKILK